MIMETGTHSYYESALSAAKYMARIAMMKALTREGQDAHERYTIKAGHVYCKARYDGLSMIVEWLHETSVGLNEITATEAIAKIQTRIERTKG